VVSTDSVFYRSKGDPDREGMLFAARGFNEQKFFGGFLQKSDRLL
jgi:hypothetical protein